MSQSLPRPIPFVGVPRQRDTSGTEDERFVNVLFERIVNEPLREHSINCVKRPGLSGIYQLSGNGRGTHGWNATGKVYSVFGNRIYSNSTAIGATLGASSGMCSFAETPPSGTELLIVSDGTDHYNINTLDNVVTIDESDDTDYPTPSLADIAWHGDGYLLKGQSNQRLWNFDLGSYTSIAAASFLSVDTHAGDLMGFRVMKDQVIALTQNRGEFFFNNGNPSGSPFLRIDQNTLGVGCAAGNSIVCSGEIMCFVGENFADNGGRAVWQITSLGKVNDISTPVINRFLNAEGSSISTCTAWIGPVSGKMVYCLNLDAAERSFVYSFDTGLWSEWTDTAGNKFNGVSAAVLNGELYIQGATDGALYKLLPTTYQDSAVNFSVTLQTARSNFGFTGRKREDSIAIMGDTTTGNLVLTVSDDDFGTYVASRNIDMSKKEKKIYRVGGAFYERSHKFTYTDNYAFRVQAWVPDIIV